MAWEQSKGMTAIHDECLLIGHLAEILHDQTILCPVLENGTVTTINDEFVRVLSHLRVKIVLYHQHDGCCLTTLMGIVVDGTGMHLVAGTIAIHVDTAIAFQLLSELWSQLGVQFLREVTQGIAQRKFLLFVSKDVLTLGCMVDLWIVGLSFR